MGPFLTRTIFIAVLASVSCAWAQNLAPGEVWRYTLLEGSTLLDDCPICGRPSIQEPMRGTFDLALIESNPVFARYELRNIFFTAGHPEGRRYLLQGSGEWKIGGEVAIRQEMKLTVGIDDGFSAKSCSFTNEDGAVQRAFPMIQIDLIQTNGTLLQTYSLTIIAAPVREMWFSTTLPFLSRNLGQTSPGDLLSIGGHIVKRNRDLTAMLGIMPAVADYGLDAVDVQPGAEILFSINNDVWSERLGQLRHGDLLSARGSIRHRNADLLAAFNPETTTDAGLDAVLMQPAGEVWFSISSNAVSRKTGGLLRPGDLLSNSGIVVRTHQQLLSRFHPPAEPNDYGLDAFYVWANGEIWFSTERGFQDAQLGPISPGDLLSDIGAIVFRNRDFVARFDPADQTNDFGLDALFLITDTVAEPTRPRITSFTVDTLAAKRLEWTGNGRVFQVEAIPRLTAPLLFWPETHIIPDFSYDFPVRDAIYNQFFYRLRQW